MHIAHRRNEVQVLQIATPPLPSSPPESRGGGEEVNFLTSFYWYFYCKAPWAISGFWRYKILFIYLFLKWTSLSKVTRRGGAGAFFFFLVTDFHFGQAIPNSVLSFTCVSIISQNWIFYYYFPYLCPRVIHRNSGWILLRFGNNRPIFN